MAEEGIAASGTGEAEQTQQGTTEDVSGLKSALAKTREELKASRAEAKRAAELEAELQKHREATQSETEKAIEAARKEGADGVRAELTAARVLDKIEVRAAGKFADPEDAQLRLAPRAADFVAKDGSIRTDEIDAALAELLEQKPHLAAGEQRRFAGSVDQGVRTTSQPDPGPGRRRIEAAYAENSKTN
jgi:hypothetical protein